MLTKQQAAEKIRKLLRRNGRTDSEADTAQIIASALAERYGVNISELDEADHRNQAVICHREIGEWYRVPCEADYASAVCRRFFEISSFTRVGLVEKIVFVGTELHIEIASYTFNFLLAEFRWQWRRRRGRCRNRQHFIYGCFLALWQKLLERFERPAEKTSALEISWKAKRQKYIADNFGAMTSHPLKASGARSAATNRGFQAGQDIDIRPGVRDGERAKPTSLPTASTPRRALPAPNPQLDLGI